MGELVCFRCKQPGHPRAQCPESTRSQAATRPPAVAAAEGERKNSVGVPPRRPQSEIADAHAWANRIRGEQPERFGYRTCGDPSDVHDSPVRRALGYAPIHRCVLRQMAEAQIVTGANQ